MVEAWILTIFCLVVTVPMAIAERKQRDGFKRANKTGIYKKVRYGAGAYIRYV